MKMRQAEIQRQRILRLAEVLNGCFELDREHVLMTELMTLFHDADLPQPVRFSSLQAFAPFIIRTVELPVENILVKQRSRQVVPMSMEASRLVFDQLGIDTQPNLELLRQLRKGMHGVDQDQDEFTPVGDVIFNSGMQFSEG